LVLRNTGGGVGAGEGRGKEGEPLRQKEEGKRVGFKGNPELKGGEKKCIREKVK